MFLQVLALIVSFAFTMEWENSCPQGVIVDTRTLRTYDIRLTLADNDQESANHSSRGPIQIEAEIDDWRLGEQAQARVRAPFGQFIESKLNAVFEHQYRAEKEAFLRHFHEDAVPTHVSAVNRDVQNVALNRYIQEGSEIRFEPGQPESASEFRQYFEDFIHSLPDAFSDSQIFSFLSDKWTTAAKPMEEAEVNLNGEEVVEKREMRAILIRNPALARKFEAGLEP